MPGLVPGIHAFSCRDQNKAWVAGTSPDMTKKSAALRQPPHPFGNRLHHRGRLLGQQRVARVRDDNERHPLGKLVLEIVARALWHERIVPGLKIEQRHAARRSEEHTSELQSRGLISY